MGKEKQKEEVEGIKALLNSFLTVATIILSIAVVAADGGFSNKRIIISCIFWLISVIILQTAIYFIEKKVD